MQTNELNNYSSHDNNAIIIGEKFFIEGACAILKRAKQLPENSCELVLNGYF
jgi:hypothetical protein